MKKVSAKAMHAIVDLWLESEDIAPEGMFYCQDSEVWVGCDNSDKNCWVEEFKTEEDVIAWLNDEPVYNVNNYPLNDVCKEEV